jgi:hypothetical protein
MRSQGLYLQHFIFFFIFNCYDYLSLGYWVTGLSGYWLEKRPIRAQAFPLPMCYNHLISAVKPTYRLKQGTLNLRVMLSKQICDLLVKVARFVTKVNTIFNIKSTLVRLVSTRRSTLLSL